MSRLFELSRNLPAKPGVYVMLDSAGNTLYVGKAKNLKNRLISYLNDHKVKTKKLVAKVCDLEITITPNETEALLLENRLIKKLQPKYNVVFKDDKSYPYIVLTKEEYPQLTWQRAGAKGDVYGPYTSVNAVRASLDTLYKVFKLRQCSLTFFKNRTRPCLQYQMQRCSAPCVRLIAKEQYQQDVADVKLFLAGKYGVVINKIAALMQEAGDRLDYELAAKLRDRMMALQALQSKQVVEKGGKKKIDVLGLAISEQLACIHVLKIRHGSILQSRQYFAKKTIDDSDLDVMQSFLSQHYLTEEDLPDELLTKLQLDVGWLRCDWVNPSKGVKSAWYNMAQVSAEQALLRKMQKKQNCAKQMAALYKLLSLEERTGYIECFDVSHTGGSDQVVSRVVFNWDGPCKSLYKKYNVKSHSKGDDYEALHDALVRRFAGEVMADLIIVDGGKGQLNVAEKALSAAGIDIPLLAIAKGPERKAGLEKLYVLGGQIDLAMHDPVLHLLQHIRDEAHRFAVKSHQQKRTKRSLQSVLQQIPGVGKQRCQALLQHFGGLAEVKRATIAELAIVDGISEQLAAKIYDYLH